MDSVLRLGLFLGFRSCCRKKQIHATGLNYTHVDVARWFKDFGVQGMGLAQLWRVEDRGLRACYLVSTGLGIQGLGAGTAWTVKVKAKGETRSSQVTPSRYKLGGKLQTAKEHRGWQPIKLERRCGWRGLKPNNTRSLVANPKLQ